MAFLLKSSMLFLVSPLIPFHNWNRGKQGPSEYVLASDPIALVAPQSHEMAGLPGW